MVRKKTLSMLYLLLFALFISVLAACEAPKNDEGAGVGITVSEVLKSDLVCFHS